MVWIVHHFAPFSCFVYSSHDFWMNRKWKQQSFANLIEFEISNDCQSMQWFWKWFNLWKCCWLEWMVMTTVTERAVEFKSCEHWRRWWRTPYISQWRHPSRQMYLNSITTTHFHKSIDYDIKNRRIGTALDFSL
jgi:hypothetical protein